MLMNFSKLAFKSVSLSLLFCGFLEAKKECCIDTYYPGMAPDDDPCYYSVLCQDPYWMHWEYMFWKFNDAPEPVPLVTTGPTVASGTPVIGQPGTKVKLGGRDVSIQARSGARFTIGNWFWNCPELGAEIGGLFFDREKNSFKIESDGKAGSKFYAVPFYNVVTDSESSVQLAVPGAQAGMAKLKISNEMKGAEANLIAKIESNFCSHLKALLGFRYLYFNERLTFRTDSPTTVAPIDIFLTKDRFQTYNNFYAGQLGFDGDIFFWDCFFLRTKALIALGAMREDLVVHGQLVTNKFNGFQGTETYKAGYFAMETNSGHHHRYVFAAMPEVNINIGWEITNWINLQFGYSFLYVTNILRPGNQIDRKINPTQSPADSGVGSTQLVGKRSPKPLFKSSHFWAQGLTVVMDLSF